MISTTDLHVHYNPRYRDSVFRSFFNEPARLLSLCNAVLGTAYTNPAELNINMHDDTDEPLQRTMRLSDAFNADSDSPQPLLEKCLYLHDYSTLVGKVKEGIRLGLSYRDAIGRAVKFCLDNGITGNFFVEPSKEVFNMLVLEWNLDDALQARFDEGRDEGINVGIESVAIKMIRRGRPLDAIHEDTGLSFQRLQQLAKDSLNP